MLSEDLQGKLVVQGAADKVQVILQMVLIQRTGAAQLLEGALLGPADVIRLDHVAADGGHLLCRAGLAVIQAEAEADDIALVRR